MAMKEETLMIKMIMIEMMMMMINKERMRMKQFITVDNIHDNIMYTYY